MDRLRRLSGLVRLLVALFVVAQFSGVVSSPRGEAAPVANMDTAIIHHQHMHDHGEGMLPGHGTRDLNLADVCCALHAYFVGVMPPLVTIETKNTIGEPLAVGPDDRRPGVASGRLDRPPRPLR
jgi:hypothetical protein